MAKNMWYVHCVYIHKLHVHHMYCIAPFTCIRTKSNNSNTHVQYICSSSTTCMYTHTLMLYNYYLILLLFSLSPHRELAYQIYKEYERFSKYFDGVKISVFFGGISVKKDEETLKSNCPHIVVGTPGRILALVRQKTLNLHNVKHFILDECDKMLEQLGKHVRDICMQFN